MGPPASLQGTDSASKPEPSICGKNHSGPPKSRDPTKLIHPKHLALILTKCCVHSLGDPVLIHHIQLVKEPSARVLWDS